MHQMPLESTVISNIVDDTNKSSKRVKYLNIPVKSESDKKEYRVIQLENGLTALLISDEYALNEEESNKKECKSEDSEMESDATDSTEEDESDPDSISENEAVESENYKSLEKRIKMAACGLCVGVGSFSDPIEIQGLAHFLEHMVFMGSEKYPQENDFDQFIKRRGGSDNASTDCEHTTFYFEIQESHLLPAMDRFAQFFINPLMKRDAIARECESIESEFQMALPSDTNRKEQLFCSLVKANHPAKKFSWGNLITLRDNIDEETLYSELKKFRKKYYSAHRMTLAVQARLSLDALEQYVKNCFSDVPINYLLADDCDKFIGLDSFNISEFRKIYKIKPVKDICELELTWVMPPLHNLYKCKPLQYVSWIVGHEGKGSLISYLRKKMWCLDILCGNSEDGFEHNSMYALFSITLVLTDEGSKCFKNVLDAVFSYLNILRCEGPQKQIFNEIKQIEEINFRFINEVDPAEYVESLCEKMHFFPPIDYITGSHLYFEYNPESIKNCIDALNSNNVNIMLFDKKFNEDSFDKIEPWFQTKYSCEELPTEWVDYWMNIEPLSEFHLPLPNIFITNDFSLIASPINVSKYPVKIHCNDKIEIWYKEDVKFCLSECYIYLYLITPFVVKSSQSCVMLDIFVVMLKQLLVEDLYDAIAAGLSYEILTSDKGIIVKVYGFNQKLLLLLSTILKYISNCYKLATKELFCVIKEDQLKSYYNTFLKPSKLNDEIRLSIITSGTWTSIERHTACLEINFEHYISFAESLTEHMYIEGLVQGNISQNDILKYIESNEFLQYGPLLPKTYPIINIHQIPLGEYSCKVKNFNSMDVNSIITNYYQSDLTSIKLNVIIQLLLMVMEEPLFDQLRTKEQLGYDVFCLLRDTFGILGFSITVCTQANKFTTEQIDDRIENFIKESIKTLKEMSKDDYDDVKKSLIKEKQCTDVCLKEEVERNWSEIKRNEYIFDRYQQEISVINDISIYELHQWVINHAMNGQNFRKLTVQVVGTANPKITEKQKNDTQSNNMKAVKHCNTFLTNEYEEKKKPEDYHIVNIKSYKSKLPMFDIIRKDS